ncbi:hypothetical protein MMC07_008451 [Pseudocyphellaria aurata]|nr:hypothetical protein [Pseudocyphellaria aurata]
MSDAMDQLQVGSSSERLHAQVSYICSIVRITRTDGDVGTEQECGEKLRYHIELLAPSSGIGTISPVIVVPDNYEAIGSCFLAVDPMKSGDCEISSITVLIWDRVLQLAIVGLLISHARDFAASMGFHHLLVTKVEGVVESILRVIGWKNCRCHGLTSDVSVGLCGGTWTGEQERAAGEIGRSQESGQAEENRTAQESGSSAGFANADERRKMTLDELIEAAAKQSSDLVIGARTEKRPLAGFEPTAADNTTPPKRARVEFNDCDDDTSRHAHHQPETIKHKTAIEAGSTLPKSAHLFSVSNEMTSPVPRLPKRGTRGRGDPRNSRMKQQMQEYKAYHAAQHPAALRSTSAGTHRKTATSITPPKEPIERNPSTLEARPHASSLGTVSDESAFLASNVSPGEPVDFTIDSTGHDSGMLGSGNVRQRLEPNLTLELQVQAEKAQQDNRDRLGTRRKRNLYVQHPTNASLIPDHANETAVGNQNTSTTSSPSRNTTTGNEKSVSVIRSRVLKNAEANRDLRQREEELTAHDLNNRPATPSSRLRPADYYRNGPADYYRPRY